LLITKAALEKGIAVVRHFAQYYWSWCLNSCERIWGTKTEQS